MVQNLSKRELNMINKAYRENMYVGLLHVRLLALIFQAQRNISIQLSHIKWFQ